MDNTVVSKGAHDELYEADNEDSIEEAIAWSMASCLVVMMCISIVIVTAVWFVVSGVWSVVRFGLFSRID